MAGEQLRVTEGEERGKVLAVGEDVVLGRGATDTLARFGDDPLLSRQHARVSRGQGGQLAIEDLGSANGTFVNDERIKSVRTLALGDLVRIGHTVFQVTDASGGVPERTRLGGDLPAVEPSEELLVTDGPAQGRRVTLEDEFLVGRSMGEEGKLGDDPQLSRRHARVARDGDRLTIEDLSSANGTFVNGTRITQSVPLAIGDSIKIGQTTLAVVKPGQQPAPAAPATHVPSPADQAPTPALPPQPQVPPPMPQPQSPQPQSPQPQAPIRARQPDPPRARPAAPSPAQAPQAPAPAPCPPRRPRRKRSPTCSARFCSWWRSSR